MILKGVMSYAEEVKNKMKNGKEQYLFNQIMGNHPYEEKYLDYHKKLLEKHKGYRSKKFRLNHKYDWKA